MTAINRKPWTFSRFPRPFQQDPVPVSRSFFLVSSRKAWPRFPYCFGQAGKPEAVLGIPPHFCPQEGSGPRIPESPRLGVDNEPSSCLYTRLVVIDAEYGSHLASCIGKHGERHASFQHLGQLVVVPHLMNKDTVNAHGEDLRAELLKLRVFFSNC